jgi:hypothetical protein
MHPARFAGTTRSLTDPPGLWMCRTLFLLAEMQASKPSRLCHLGARGCRIALPGAQQDSLASMSTLFESLSLIGPCAALLPAAGRQAPRPYRERPNSGEEVANGKERKGKEKALGGFGAGNGNNAVSLASIGDMREREMRRDRMNRSLGPPRLDKITGTPYFLLFLPSRIVHPLGNTTMEMRVW